MKKKEQILNAMQRANHDCQLALGDTFRVKWKTSADLKKQSHLTVYLKIVLPRECWNKLAVVS